MDASYTVQNDCKSHTESVMSLGKGEIVSQSLKQKINTWISTELELVGDDYMAAHILGTTSFLKYQSYKVKGTIVIRITKVKSYWRQMAIGSRASAHKIFQYGTSL